MSRSAGTDTRTDAKRSIAASGRAGTPVDRMALAGSALVHAALALLFIIGALERRRPPEPLPPPAFAVVFSGGTPEGPTAPERAPESSDAAAGAPEPLPPPPPAPPAVPRPPVVAAPPPPTVPVTPAPPRPPETPRQTVPFPGALDLTAAPPVRLPSPERGAPAAPSRPRGSLDLTPGAAALGPANVQPMARIRGAEVGADWRNAFRAWLEANKRYPREAIEQDEEGSLTVHLVVEADGRVRVAELSRPSRSFWLNRSAVAMFRGATLPPFPPGSAERQVTIDLTINYILIR